MNLEKAIEIIRQGGIIIFPTDTAFGIGCRIDKEESVRKLNKMLKRPNGMPSPVLFDSIERVSQYVRIKPKVRKLMDNYWPGALTLILHCNRVKVPSSVRGEGRTLGVRIPDHEVPIKLIKVADIPIIGTSANFHGEKTPFKFSQLDKRLIKLVDLCLEGETSAGLASTVVDCTSYPWKIIRQGEVLPDI